MIADSVVWPMEMSDKTDERFPFTSIYPSIYLSNLASQASRNPSA